MSARRGRRLQCAAVCLAIAVYAGLSHYCNTVAGARELGAMLAFGPLIVLIAVLAWRGTPPLVALLLTAALLGVLYDLWPMLTRNYSLFYLVQESGAYCLLGATFGRSLLPNQIPTCTRLADQVHGPLTPLEFDYTRRVTAAWSVFFFAVVAVSILLYWNAPLRVWSIYINFCVAPLICLMFGAEYCVRRQILPPGRAGLMETVRVYLASPE